MSNGLSKESSSLQGGEDVNPPKGLHRRDVYALADWFAETESDEDIPAECLALGYRWHVWHQPSGYRSLHLNESTFRLHVPDLLIAVLRGGAYVFALQGSTPPSGDTSLYEAPFPGLGRHGWIRGWRPGSQDASLADRMTEIMGAFDRCALNAMDNDWDPPCRHPMGTDKLWVEMIQRRWKRFPVKYLRRAPYTVGGLIERVRAGSPFSMCPSGDEPERVSQA